MRQRRKKAVRYLKLSIFCFAIQAASVLLEPFALKADGSGLTGIGYLLGVVFWLGLLSGCFFFWMTWNLMHQSTVYQEQKMKRMPGILGFFRTDAAKMTDPIWIAALAISVLGNVWDKFPHMMTLSAMSLALFMFYLHMIVNGRVYRYMISNERKERRSEEGED